MASRQTCLPQAQRAQSSAASWWVNERPVTACTISPITMLSVFE
jgi:hypothetical protein